jgi:hypothetical protein
MTDDVVTLGGRVAGDGIEQPNVHPSGNIQFTENFAADVVRPVLARPRPQTPRIALAARVLPQPGFLADHGQWRGAVHRAGTGAEPTDVWVRHTLEKPGQGSTVEREAL